MSSRHVCVCVLSRIVSTLSLVCSAQCVLSTQLTFARSSLRQIYEWTSFSALLFISLLAVTCTNESKHLERGDWRLFRKIHAMGLFSRHEPAQTLDIPLAHTELKSRPDTGKLKLAAQPPRETPSDAPPAAPSERSASSRRRVTFQNDGSKADSSTGQGSIGQGNSSSSSQSSSSSSSSQSSADSSSGSSSGKELPAKAPSRQKKVPITASTAAAPPVEPSLPEPALQAPPSGEVALNLQKSRSRSPLDSLRVKLVNIYWALRLKLLGAPRSGKGSFAEPAEEDMRQHL